MRRNDNKAAIYISRLNYLLAADMLAVNIPSPTPLVSTIYLTTPYRRFCIISRYMSLLLITETL